MHNNFKPNFDLMHHVPSCGCILWFVQCPDAGLPHTCRRHHLVPYEYQLIEDLSGCRRAAVHLAGGGGGGGGSCRSKVKPYRVW